MTKILTAMGLLLALGCMSTGTAAEAEGSELDRALNRHLLTEYGRCTTARGCEAALQEAFAVLREKGGILVVPASAPQAFVVVNDSQTESGIPGVTVYDYRGGIERIYVPGMGAEPSLSHLGRGGRITERSLTHNLNWQGVYSSEKLVSTYPGGASSYMQYTDRAIQKGQDAKIYVPTLRGIFVGQMLKATGERRGHGGKDEFFWVKKLGMDGPDPYFEADAKEDHPKGALVYNKNVVNSMTINDLSYSDNQSMSFIIDRRTYGTGDSFAFQASLHYMGDFMSGAGDEGGVGAAVELVHELSSFRGEVESWNPETGRLKYAARAKKPDTLGMSRPIINLNEKKWHTQGKITIVAPGFSYLRDQARHSTLVVGSKDCGWTDALVGRWIAVDHPSEYYAPDESPSAPQAGLGFTVRRWWHITKILERSDGRFNMFIETHWWGANRNGGIKLFVHSNYATDVNHAPEFDYIIAPGSYASDVRDAISGHRPGWGGIAHPDDKREIVLAPAAWYGKGVDFERGDKIIQPAAADVWLPVGYRVRHVNSYPGMMGGGSFSSKNSGRVQIGAGLALSGRGGTLESILAYTKDKKPQYAAGVSISASTENAIQVRGPVGRTAMDLWSGDGNIKKIQWRPNYKKSKRRTSSIHVDPDTGDLVFSVRALNYSHSSTILQGGLSATQTPAKNLRGINVAVESETLKMEVSFPGHLKEVDANYSITVQPTWKTMDWIAAKTETGFVVEFSEEAPRGARLDWQLIR